MELSKQYRPEDVEQRIYRFWEDADVFRASTGVAGRAPFSVVIPPPNITGVLHMGHALNNSLQDIVVRYHRMLGDPTCWFPGTDHAGIATQNVVEKALAAEGTSRHELGREAFVERVWAWKAEYGSTILNQLKALGCSCDWSRLRFTLDEGLSDAVRAVFVSLYEQDLVYRGAYLVNWCPRCHTAISDLEVEHEDIEGALYHIRYPLENGGHVVIATTRPETMLGDTAIAVNPDDERYARLIGQTARLPILNRPLPVVGSEHVDPEFGTGVLKITPAHDPIDFEIGQTHGLESISILNEDGTLNDAAGPFAGMERDVARRAVVERLEAEGLLERTEPYRHAVGHCERCSTAIEPLISTQWFVRMRALADRAIEAVQRERIEFIPDRWTKLYFDWLENIRDWCISRQLWWGHRIPVWYGPDDRPFAARSEAEAAKAARAHYGEEVPLRQDEDVLDTWFSSWLWPFSVMGWPEETDDLRRFFPTSFLLTAFDILYFWVSRMVMASLHFMNEVPFRTVYITPLIVDEKGKKMSKSKGNAIDPIDLLEEYGADAVRLAMAHITGKGRTVRMPWAQLTESRNFLNKVWNMARFILMNLGSERPNLPADVTALEDRFILSRLARTTQTVRDHLEGYHFNLAVEALYEFTWHDVCDWYVELAKPRLQSGADDEVKGVLCHLLRQVVLLLHPFVPFITEEIWQALGEPRSISLASYPESETGRIDPEAEETLEALKDVVTQVRAIRADFGLPHGARPSVLLAMEQGALADRLRTYEAALRLLTKTDSWTIGDPIEAPREAARRVLGFGEVIVPLAGLVDIDAERARLHRDLEEVLRDETRSRAKLDNERFLEGAPDEVVQKERDKLEEFTQRKERLESNLAALGG